VRATDRRAADGRAADTDIELLGYGVGGGEGFDEDGLLVGHLVGHLDEVAGWKL
jgi:hypothetical protein